jgi:hypothetical protein
MEREENLIRLFLNFTLFLLHKNAFEQATRSKEENFTFLTTFHEFYFEKLDLVQDMVRENRRFRKLISPTFW